MVLKRYRSETIIWHIDIRQKNITPNTKLLIKKKKLGIKQILKFKDQDEHSNSSHTKI